MREIENVKAPITFYCKYFRKVIKHGQGWNHWLHVLTRFVSVFFFLKKKLKDNVILEIKNLKLNLLLTGLL